MVRPRLLWEATPIRVRRLDGHWSTATCGGIISCPTVVRSTSQATRPSARGCGTDKHDRDVWWNRLSQGRASSGFPCWNRGRERSDAIPRARGAHVDRWKTTVHSAVRQCTTSPIPAGVEIVSRKTYLRETRGRRVAELEHNFNDDKDVRSGAVDGTKWTGVSVFHLSVAVTPHVVRTGKGRGDLATATERNLGRD